MSKKQIIRLICLNLGIVLLNVILFSKGLVGITLGSDALLTAIGVTTIVMSLIGFGYGNYTLLFSEPENTPLRLYKGTEFVNPKDYIDALEDLREKKVFENDIRAAVDQIYSLQDKDKSLDSILEQYFSPGELTYTKFQSVIDSVQLLFYNNIKKMINRMIIFDYKNYTKLRTKLHNAPLNGGTSVSSRSVGEQMKIYDEHLSYVHGLVDMNEDVLLKLDSLLLEISKLDDIGEAELEKMIAIQEINELISNTKYYKN